MKIFLSAIFLSISVFLNAQEKSSGHNLLNKTTSNDNYNYIAINQLKMWIGNNGMGSHNPFTDKHGLLWPGGENAILNLAFADGLIWGGFIGDSLFVNGNTYRYGLQAGKILDNGLPDEPSLSKYRIYKIKKNWETLPPGPTKERYQKDYIEWPGEDGAPYYDENNDRKFTTGIDKPLFIGDEVLWCVMNDMDPYRTTYTFGTMPIGLEVQLTVYGYTHASLENVLIKKYKIINKSSNTIDSMFFGYFSDCDLGLGSDDHIGCDSTLNLAYQYNADNNDEGYYGYNPPAMGYKLLQGPILKSNNAADSAHYNNNWYAGLNNLRMSSFSFYYYDFWHNVLCEETNIPFTRYWMLNGLFCDGSPMINPSSGISTKFPYSGNPLNSSGWFMINEPSDYRFYLNTGPITMAPADTQEVVIAIIAAQGTSNLQSIAELKKSAKTVQYFYDNYNPELTNASYTPPLPGYYHLSQNYPNPFNPKTKIDYELPINGFTALAIYDILGNRISTLVNKEQTAGSHSINFDATNLSSGIYFYTLTSNSYTKTRKMILMK